MSDYTYPRMQPGLCVGLSIVASHCYMPFGPAMNLLMETHAQYGCGFRELK